MPALGSIQPALCLPVLPLRLGCEPARGRKCLLRVAKLLRCMIAPRGRLFKLPDGTLEPPPGLHLRLPRCFALDRPSVLAGVTSTLATRCARGGHLDGGRSQPAEPDVAQLPHQASILNARPRITVERRGMERLRHLLEAGGRQFVAVRAQKPARLVGKTVDGRTLGVDRTP